MKFDLELKSIEYVKIDIPDENVSYKVAISTVSEEMTSATMVSAERLELKTPHDIIISYVTKEAMYTAPATLLTIQNDKPNVTFLVKTPEEIERIQRREHYRVKVEIEAKILYEEGGSLKTIVCKTCDLSLGGIKVALKGEDKIPEDVRISIAVENETITTKAKLVNTKTSSNVKYASFRFEDLQFRHENILSGYCFKMQAKSISKKI